ncbi:aspartate aminotransferase, mitochondrial [Pelomyxa schiedti]|nr:aspartate aminotransferase, mitochondrial [Pelomyxa schiedti]
MASTSSAVNLPASVVPTTEHKFFWGVTGVPLDPILGVQIAYNADLLPDAPTGPGSVFKLNLGVGTYRGADGKPFVLDVVRKVEKELAQGELTGHIDKDYLPVDGLKQFQTASAQLLLGEGYDSAKNRIVAMQTLSGTGALRLGASLLAKLMPRTIYLPTPSYRNHKSMFPNSGCTVAYYRYLKPSGVLDFEGMCEDLRLAPPGSVILLHMCAHNPSGIDPSQEQWRQLAEVIENCRHYTFFDCAYQGFASGDVDLDAYPPRYFLSRGMQFMAAHSYSKNMSLYAERVGALYVVCADAQIASHLLSHAKQIARAAYSNPPAHGARIAARVLTNPQYRAEWLLEVKGMVDRIDAVRRQLYEMLVAKGTPGDWSILLRQRGLFSLLPLSGEQVETLKNKWHIYMCFDGRTNLAGLSAISIGYFANALDEVVRQEKVNALRISGGLLTAVTSHH